MRFQLHRHAPGALRVVLPALLGQVGRHLPDAFGQALDDASAAQGFQPADMGRHHIGGVAAGHGLRLGNGHVMIGAVQTIGGQRGDGPVRRAHAGRTLDFHHRAGRVLLQFRLGRQRDVVGFAVDAVEHQVALVVQLIGEALGGDAADDRAGVLARLEHRQLALRAAHCPLHRADDVATLAHRAQRLFRLGMDRPHAGLRLTRQSHALQALQAAHQQQALALQPGFVEALDMHQAVHGLALQAAIQPGPPRLIDFALHGALDLQLGARPQPFGGDFGGALAHAARDVVLRDDEVFAGVVLAAQDDVRMRIVGVPVIDRHPLQPRAQVGFHARHQVAGVAPQIV